MRGHNVIRLRDGESLLWHGRGRNRICRVFVPGDETKNEKPLRFILPPHVIRLIEIYRREFLPLLGYEDQGYLCPGRKNATKAAAQLSNQLAKWSGKRLGIRMTGHKWRHAVGYIYLLRNPGKYEPVRRMLGHASVTVTEKYYAFMLGEDAQAEIDKTFDDIRERGRQRLRSNQRARGKHCA